VSATTILIAGVGIVLLLPPASRIAGGRFDPFEPIVIFALAWGVMFVVRPAAILIRDDFNFYGVDIGETLDRAVMLGLLGAVAFVVGYELPVGRRLAGRLPESPDEFSPSRALAGAVAVSVLGVLALALVLLPSGGLDAVDTFLSGRSADLNELIQSSTLYLWYGSLVVIPAALVGFAIALARRTPTAVALAIGLTGIALLRTIPTGNRIFLLVLLGGMIVFVFLRAGRRPGLVSLVVGFLAALVFSYAVLGFRTPETRESFSAAFRQLAETPSQVLSPLVRGPDAEMAPALAGALLVVPDELSYRFGGATVGDLILRPIPRELWADKPEVPGREVTATVWPEARELGNFDPAFTPVLFFYWDFGLPGVFLGVAILGAMARCLYEYFLRRPESLVVQLLFAAGTWYLVVAVRHDPVSVLVWALVLFVPLVGVFRLASVVDASDTVRLSGRS